MTVLNLQIGARADNKAFRNPSGTWTIYDDGEGGGDSPSYCGTGGASSDRYWNSYRFTLSQAIPALSTINSAYLSMWSTSTPFQWNAEDYLRLWVTDAADPAQKSAASERPSFDSGSTTLYPATVNGGVRWPGSGGLTLASDAFMQSVDIKTLLQYLVDTYGGLANGAHVEVWVCEPEVNGANNNSQVETDFYGRSAAHAAKLDIDFTAITIEQEGFRWRADDGSESAATWLAAQDTNVTQPKGVNTRLRMIVNTTSDAASKKFKLRYRRVGDEGWRDLKV